jgi:energy-coupling factor transporter ATP-binding protein EcfA2
LLRKPVQYVSRIVQTNRIIEDYEAVPAVNQIYMVTGVRGSGKTVMMTNIADILSKRDDWIVVELNATRDLLQSLASRLYAVPRLHDCFLKAKLDFSAFGLGVTIENAAPVTDVEDMVAKMLDQLQKLGKRLLITIDEVVYSEQMKVFASAFQIFMRQEYPIFILMTGLYENIYKLQNDKSLTFLYRAPKIILEPLNLTAVRQQYKNIFALEEEKAERMAALTRGYPFAFQVLGYLYWEHRDTRTLDEILPEYDQYLEEYVYSKIWSEMSEKDKEILQVLAVSGEIKVKNLREKLGLASEQFSVYRERLKRKGVIDTRQYGMASMALPRFEEFIKMRML